MSTGFNILFSSALTDGSQPVEVYKKLLAVVLESSHISTDSCQLTIYRGQRPFNYGAGSNDPHIVFKDRFDGGVSVEKLLDLIDSVKTEDLYVGVSCAYKRLDWNNEICDSEPSFGSLVIEYEAPTFDGGHRNKRLGPYHLLFDERKCFSPHAVDFSRCPAESPEALLKFMRYAQNIDVPRNLFKQIAALIKPQHQVLVTEGDRVNPLNFHMVYHAELAGFLFDAAKILQLHHYGGGYFYVGRTGDSDASYNSLRSNGSPYGDFLRFREHAEELERQLDLFCTVLGVSGLSETPLEEEEILEIITSIDSLELETIGGGLYVMNPRFLLGYLDALYIKLLDAAAYKIIGKN